MGYYTGSMFVTTTQVQTVSTLPKNKMGGLVGTVMSTGNTTVRGYYKNIISATQTPFGFVEPAGLIGMAESNNVNIILEGIVRAKE